MPKRTDEQVEKELMEQVAKAKPGFVPVRQVRGHRNSPKTEVNSGTPDTHVLKEKSQQLQERSSDEVPSTASLRRKFLQGPDSDDLRPDAPAYGNPQKGVAPPVVKGNPRIVSVRPTRGADSDEGVPPKDLQIVMDDEGQIGESS